MGTAADREEREDRPRRTYAVARGEQLFGSARTNVGAGHEEKGEDDDVAAQGGERDRLSRWPVNQGEVGRRPAAQISPGECRRHAASEDDQASGKQDESDAYGFLHDPRRAWSSDQSLDTVMRQAIDADTEKRSS